MPQLKTTRPSGRRGRRTPATAGDVSQLEFEQLSVVGLGHDVEH